MSTRTPILRQISWLATIPQFAIMATAIALGSLLDPHGGVIWGACAYLFYSIGSRRLIARHQRRGIALIKQQRYAEAISEFQQSLAFFGRHPWIDRFRCVILMSSSAMSYCEMALVNIAWCYGQLGDGKRAREYYVTCLDRFPNSTLAVTAIRLMDAARNAS